MFYGIGKFDFYVYRKYFHEVTIYLRHYLSHVWTFQFFSSLNYFRLTLCIVSVSYPCYIPRPFLHTWHNITIFILWATSTNNKVKSMWNPKQSCVLRRIITNYSFRNRTWLAGSWVLSKTWKKMFYGRLWRNVTTHFWVLAQLSAWWYQSGFIRCSISCVSNKGNCLRRSAKGTSKKIYQLPSLRSHLN